MSWFFKDIEKKLNIKELDTEKLMYRVMPQFVAEVMSKYFRMKVEGTENIPKQGGAIIAPNHSGYSGFDAFLLGHHIYKNTKRTPRVLTHKLWFVNETTAVPMKKFGFIEATKQNGLKALDKKQLVVLFPEGEYGNFKPSNKAYHLQEFKRGFVRMAIEKQVPIVPTLILGAEETHINLAQLKFTKYLRGTIFPLPLNIIPLPAKWHIIFMEPIELPTPPNRWKTENSSTTSAPTSAKKCKNASASRSTNVKTCISSQPPGDSSITCSLQPEKPSDAPIFFSI